MPNYAGIGDFVGPLAEAMKQYREGNPQSAQNMVKQINELMNAYETQQRAGYQSAQAFRTQQLADQEARMFPEDVAYRRAQTGAQEALGEQRLRSGELSGARTETEEALRDPTVQYWEERPKTEQARQASLTASANLSKAKLALENKKLEPSEAMKALVAYTPELKSIFGDRDVTADDIDTVMNVLNDLADAETEKVRKDYLLERIEYTKSAKAAQDARAANLKSGGTGEPLSALDQKRMMELNEIKRLVSQGYTVLQAINAVNTTLTPSSVQGIIESLDEQMNALLITDEEKARLQKEKSFYVDLQKKLTKPFTEVVQPQGQAGKSPVLDWDDWSSRSSQAKAKYLIEQKNQGVKRVVIEKLGKPDSEYTLNPDGTWAWQKVGQTQVKQAQPQTKTQAPKQTTAPKTKKQAMQRPEQQTTQTTIMHISKIKTVDDFNSTMDTLISTGGNQPARAFIANNKKALMQKFGWTEDDINVLLESLR